MIFGVWATVIVVELVLLFVFWRTYERLSSVEARMEGQKEALRTKLNDGRAKLKEIKSRLRVIDANLTFKPSTMKGKAGKLLFSRLIEKYGK